jgi:hypothetical protein
MEMPKYLYLGNTVINMDLVSHIRMTSYGEPVIVFFGSEDDIHSIEFKNEEAKLLLDFLEDTTYLLLPENM